MSRFNAVRRFCARAGLAAALLAPVSALFWTTPGLAASGCLVGAATNKLCLDLRSIPGDSVQPSQLAGTPTYVKYTAVVSNTALATSRFVNATFTLSPASGFVSVSSESDVTCSLNGSTVSCFIDKLDRIDPKTITLVAEAPRVPTSATEMVNTAVFGFEGNTATVAKSVAISTTSGASYVPAGEEVTVVSEPEADNPEDQVTAEDPLFAKVTLPPQPVDYYADISIISDGPVNANCTTGVFLTVFDGGPYLCRDGLNPRRWAEFDIGETEGALPPVLFTAQSPMQFTMMWDATLVRTEQQAPNDIATTGLPPFAVFYGQPSQQSPYPDSIDARAFADSCNTLVPMPPCISTVERFGNGDWRVSGLKQTDQSDIPTPVEQLLSSLNFLLGTADASGVLPPIMN